MSFLAGKSAGHYEGGASFSEKRAGDAVAAADPSAGAWSSRLLKQVRGHVASLPASAAGTRDLLPSALTCQPPAVDRSNITFFSFQRSIRPKSPLGPAWHAGCNVQFSNPDSIEKLKRELKLFQQLGGSHVYHSKDDRFVRSFAVPGRSGPGCRGLSRDSRSTSRRSAAAFDQQHHRSAGDALSKSSSSSRSGSLGDGTDGLM